MLSLTFETSNLSYYCKILYGIVLFAEETLFQLMLHELHFWVGLCIPIHQKECRQFCRKICDAQEYLKLARVGLNI